MIGLFAAWAQPCLSAAQIESGVVRYFDAGELQTLSAYFSSTFTSRGRVIVRTDETAVEGLYFQLLLEEELDQWPNELTLKVWYWEPDDLEATQRELELTPAELSTREVWIGLTGDDWPDPDAIPVAWKVEIEDRSGGMIADWKSFLWSLK